MHDELMNDECAFNLSFLVHDNIAWWIKWQIMSEWQMTNCIHHLSLWHNLSFNLSYDIVMHWKWQWHNRHSLICHAILKVKILIFVMMKTNLKCYKYFIKHHKDIFSFISFESSKMSCAWLTIICQIRHLFWRINIFSVYV